MNKMSFPEYQFNDDPDDWDPRYIWKSNDVDCMALMGSRAHHFYENALTPMCPSSPHFHKWAGRW